MVSAPFLALNLTVWIAQDLLQKLAEQFLAGLLLLEAQAAPQLGLARIHEQQSRLTGTRTVSRQLHVKLLSGASLQQ
jgi:hypothetical protein